MKTRLQENVLALLPELKWKILDYLTPKEFFTLRLVSKSVKTMIEDYTIENTKSHKGCNSYEVTISEKGKGLDMEKFLESKIYFISNFTFYNESLKIYTQNQLVLENFKQRCSFKIKKLCLLQFFDFQFAQERPFIDSLTNLEELKVFYAKFRSEDSILDVQVLPQCFQSLTRLEMFFIVESADPDVSSVPTAEEVIRGRISQKHWIWSVMHRCPKLEMILFPFFAQQPSSDDGNAFERMLIEWLRAADANGQSLKEISVTHRDRIQIDLISLCSSKQIGLTYFHDVTFYETPIVGENGQCILSVQLNNFAPNFLNPHLPNLETFYLQFNLLFPPDELNPVDNPLTGDWPKLKSINLYWVTDEVYRGERILSVTNRVTSFLQFLFNTQQRPTVQSLLLKFEKIRVRKPRQTGTVNPSLKIKKASLNENKDKKSELDRRRKCDFPEDLLTAKNITTNLFNLTELTIIGWNAEDETFLLLWSGLPSLQTLQIGDCSTLSDYGFRGVTKRGQDAAFLKLTRLKKLTLDLEFMPLVTNKFFKEVLHWMPLKGLYLDGKHNDNVTRKGIESLLGGPFASSVQRFAFNQKSLKGVCKRELVKLKNQFRTFR